MSNAALTFVFNEKHNLPIWIKYYGELFGYSNLYVIDRSSDDGSTDNLGDVNHIKIPRPRFDEDAKTHLMSSFHSALTSTHDAVIVTDADEILIPDPDHFKDLNDYVNRMGSDYVNAIGIDIVHILSREMPIDLSKPILSQRAFGRFHAPECKHLLSRIPIRWLPGLHSSNKPPIFDPWLFIFHLKVIDYGFAMHRQQVNLETEWSQESLAAGYGQHHRWSLEQFVHQSFMAPMDVVNNDRVSQFEFRAEIDELKRNTELDQNGYYRVPMNISKIVRIPDRFRLLL